ncbi:MAG: membrane protein insertion efficiency factor YidD [Candidatus Doudnabacteria bacterium CG10_big_fil_rev_8_21_14_0_10_41_10]|uniref:Putative membrane protein insertion efficiency factor n=1 Tax=Candidatus Doudnabacteria bacterium CG10_big_fil_rev_8_21_14_0_10_41_10 TaxID=1974551 RepID=A0A2H0VC51_9BACT|nr:MAG: membrane protein insertion efficiency factor YidD [Candidatus Doudnabacteria bacterium CG10_big_fil_rev_8_21_14_0_10_41_10]
MKYILIKIIEIYQATFSPDHGWFKHHHPYGYCRFYPSCSEYTRQAIEKKGAVKGTFMGIKRVLKCNPYTQPEVDHVLF